MLNLFVCSGSEQNTSGIDRILWLTDEDKMMAIFDIKTYLNIKLRIKIDMKTKFLLASNMHGHAYKY